MLKLIQTEFLKLRRRKFVWLMLLAALFMPFFALFYFQHIGETGIDPVQFYKWTAFSYTPWIILPVVLGMLCTMLMYDENQYDMLKQLWIIPVNETKLTAAKMIVSLIFSILIYLLLFIITFSVEAILHFQSLSIGLVLGFLKTYLLDGLGIFLAISPIIALVAKMKKGYWLALVFAEIYSFAGLFASMSATLKALYPITAVFNISGYYETVTLNWIYSVFVLLLCGGFSALILRNLNHKKKWRIK